MDRTKIETIYKIIIKGMPLTFQSLSEHGLNIEDMKNLVNENIIKQTGPNKFELSSIHGLYNYGIKLFLLKGVKEAREYFFKCFELDSSNRDVCLQIMLLQIKLGQFSKAFELFPHLEQISEEKHRFDNNLYLYLFNLLTKCPEEYKERLREMDYDSYLLPSDEQILFREEQNSIRQEIIKNKLKHALNMLNNLIAKKVKYSVSDEFLKEFIIHVINLENKFRKNILEFAKNKDYRAIISFLDTKSKKRFLTNGEVYIYMISQAIINIKETNTISPISVTETTSLYEAIRGNNFALAQTLETRNLKQYNEDPNENAVYILLTQINQLICELEQQKNNLQGQIKTYIKL